MTDVGTTEDATPEDPVPRRGTVLRTLRRVSVTIHELLKDLLRLVIAPYPVTTVLLADRSLASALGARTVLKKEAMLLMTGALILWM